MSARRANCILVIGDAPNVSGGLARIARDLLQYVFTDLDVDVYQAGLRYDGSVWPWHVFPINDEAGWGKDDIERIVTELERAYDGIVVFTVWDPHRCFEITRYVHTRRMKGANIHLWGYFPIDGHDDNERFTGPAAAAVHRYDRVLAYGRYGQRILQNVLGRSCSALPHGLTQVWRADPAAWERVQEQTGWEPQIPVIGVVAANQPRKDWGTALRALTSLAEKRKVRIWLHVDAWIRYWSLPALLEVYGWAKGGERAGDVAVTGALTDEELVRWYSVASLTLAPGLGEGFGYPIVESLACGTPVLHLDYAGGAELIPEKSWLIPYEETRLDGIYAIQRPVLNPAALAVQLGDVLNAETVRQRSPEWYLLQTVHLRWPRLAPHWRAWVKKGLKELPWLS